MTTLVRTRFRDLVAAEWIKLMSLRSTPWTLGLTALVVLGSVLVETRGQYAHASPVQPEFALRAAFPVFGTMVLMLVAVSVGAIAVTSEYGSGLIRTTTVAVPARGSVILAKSVVVAVFWTVAGVVLSTASFVVSQAILSGRDTGIAIGHPAALTALLGASLLAPVCALTGLGLGVLIRHTAGTLVTGVVLLQLVPPFLSPTLAWSAALNHAMILSAWQRLAENYGPPRVGGYPYASLAESWIVYAAWPLVAVVVASIVVRKRDV